MRSDVSFKDDTGRKYKWRGNAPGRSFEVCLYPDPVVGHFMLNANPSTRDILAALR